MISTHTVQVCPRRVKQGHCAVTTVTKITNGPVCDVRDGGDGCSLLYALAKTHVLPRMPVDFAVNQDGEVVILEAEGSVKRSLTVLKPPEARPTSSGARKT